jgi:hypothetical protein
VKKIAQFVFFAVVLALAINAVRRLVPPAHAQTTRFVPYTVVLTETTVDGKGNAHHGGTLVQAMRSDGSMTKDLNTPSHEREVHLITGEIVHTNDVHKRMSTEYSSVPASAFIRSPASMCAKNIDGGNWTNDPLTVSGETTVSGYRAVGVTRRNITQWYALDYGCALVGQKTDFKEGGSSRWKLLSLTPGEPNPNQFDLANYAEVRPSGLFYDSPQGSCDDTCKAAQAKMWQSRDNHYADNHLQHGR